MFDCRSEEENHRHKDDLRWSETTSNENWDQIIEHDMAESENLEVENYIINEKIERDCRYKLKKKTKLDLRHLSFKEWRQKIPREFSKGRLHKILKLKNKLQKINKLPTKTIWKFSKYYIAKNTEIEKYNIIEDKWR